MNQPDSYLKMMRDYTPTEVLNSLKPETRRYLREARSIASYRQNRLEDVTETGPMTADERQYFNVADIALRLRATTLRLDSLAIKGAAALALLLLLATPVLAIPRADGSESGAPLAAYLTKDGAATKKPRARPSLTVSVKVYAGRPQVARLSKSGCIAWVPTVAAMDSGWSACQKLLAPSK